MRLATKPAIAVVAVVLALAIGAALFGGLWSAIASEDVKLFPSEHDAAYAASLNIKAAPAMSSLKQGEAVTVIWDTYGKDYWACYVKTSTILAHPNQAKYPRQRVLVIASDGYAYLVPFVEEEDHYFLKTVIPSRKATRDYLGQGEQDAKD